VSLLLDLSLRGSLVAGAVWLLDRACESRLTARDRRGWWLVVPLAFLVAIPVPILPSSLAASPAATVGTQAAAVPRPAAFDLIAASSEFTPAPFWCAVWLAGVALSLLPVIIQTRAALRRWSALRLSTDPALLGLLEDAKADLGITAPIGLVTSTAVAAPAIMGWLRPRLLLPETAATTLTREQLRAVLLHELAHFRALDVPLNWLFTVAQAVHWFNPAVHLAARGWSRFREEAADETALRALGDASAGLYAGTLLAALRPVSMPAAPFGALAIGESIHHLKRRLLMINRYSNRTSRSATALLILTLLALAALLHPVRAAAGDAKQAAVAAMQAWLAEIDAAHYDQSWTDAAPSFQKALSSAQWVSALTSVRAPLGKCQGRKLDSALEQAAAPSPAGTQHGDFVIAQFDSSYENLKYAVETVTFEKAPDGSWKAAGYYIKPK
jgi:beta-lactamase regulating signal transducer with metallopeptidase domain